MGKYNMKRAKKIGGMLLAAGMMIMLTMTSLAKEEEQVRDFPGIHGSGTVQKGPIAGSVSEGCWYTDDDDDDDGPDSYTYQRGWRYSPGGWWFRYANGSWPSDGWHYIDGRWYVFDNAGHMMTGWYTDGNGNKFYLNPTDDGTLGSMRIGWQVIGGKAYYFNTMSDGTLGKLLTNTATPDGYQVGADGSMGL